MKKRKCLPKDVKIVFSTSSASREASCNSSIGQSMGETSNQSYEKDEPNLFFWPSELLKDFVESEITDSFMTTVHMKVLKCLSKGKSQQLLQFLDANSPMLQCPENVQDEDIDMLVNEARARYHSNVQYVKIENGYSLFVKVDNSLDKNGKIRSKIDEIRAKKQTEKQAKMMKERFQSPLNTAPRRVALADLNDREKKKQQNVDIESKENEIIENKTLCTESTQTGVKVISSIKVNENAKLLPNVLGRETKESCKVSGQEIRQVNIEPCIPQVVQNDTEDDVKYVEEDEGILPETYGVNECDNEPLGPFYYPPQTYLANKIVERIKLIFHHYHDGKELSEFTGFDFRIYTYSSNMLEKQTWTRLSKKESGCLPEKLYAGSDRRARETAKKKVGKYIKTTITMHEKLMKNMKRQKDKLFLIVADEAHWGITDKDQARHKLVNTWNDEEHPNVVVLLVTATPYSLLSQMGYIPKMYYKYNNEDKMGLQEKPEFKDEDQIEAHDIRERVYKKLHHVQWTESFNLGLTQGLIVKLKIPMKNKSDSLVQLCCKQETGKSYLLWKQKLPDDGSSVLDQYLMEGNADNTVTIKTADKEWLLVIHNEEVKFVKLSDVPKLVISTFCIIDTFGDGVVLLTFKAKGNEEQLYYDEDSQQIKYRRHRLSLKPDDFEVFSPDCSFLLEQCQPSQSLGSVREYISLNYYINSMRNEDKEKRLIRGDDDFIRMEGIIVSKIKKKLAGYSNEEILSDILTAEYSYYILIVSLLRKHGNSLKDLIEKYPEERDNKMNSFITRLEEQQHGQDKKQTLIYPIQPLVFDEFLEYLSTESQKEFERDFPHWNMQNGDTLTEEESLSFLSCIIHMKTEKLRENVTSKCNVESQMHWNLKEKIEQVLWKSETGRIVNGLVPRDLHKVDGEMKIIRVKKTNHGNKMYKTLCIARKESSENDYAFEVLRDYDKATLSQHFEGKLEKDKMEKTASYRICKRLQPKKCTFVSNETFESCPCCYKESENFQQKIDLKCEKCGHMHKSIEKYTDIEGLPCILILINKGRLGDTFPQSFNAMDLRLCYRHRGDEEGYIPANTKKGKSPLYLSCLVQEIGRLCRYTKKSDEKSLPYALIGGYLENILKDSLKVGAAYYSCLKLTDSPVIPDRKMNKSDQGENNNRILLHAEPQIGKTGVYLKVISILRKLFRKKQLEEKENDGKRQKQSEESESDDEMESESDDEMMSEESASDDEIVSDVEEPEEAAIDSRWGDASCWNIPYWKDMEIGKKLPTNKTVGKYVRYFGDYKYREPPKIISYSAIDSSNVKPVKPKNFSRGGHQAYSFKIHTDFQESNFRAYNHNNHNLCESCNVQFETTEIELHIPRKKPAPGIDVIDHDEVKFKISVPLTKQYKHLLKFVEQFTSTESSALKSLSSFCATCEDSCLKTWIFIPTHNRSHTGYFHLYHTMKNHTEDIDTCHYITVLVVRNTDFQAYCQLWKSTHAILEIPDTFPGEERDAHEGGIGFARLAVQVFAEYIGLPWIFMLDDNVSYITEIKTEGSQVKRKNDISLDEHKVSLFKALKHLEQHVVKTTIDVPGEHHAVNAMAGLLKNFTEYPGNVDEPLEKYSGPSSKYGVIGVKKHRPTIYKTKRPFLKTHVYSLLLLNISELQNRHIRYKPWHVFEDLNLNNDCDSNNLWVCKYNRFTISKCHMKTWIPKVYHWTVKTKVMDIKKSPTDYSTDILISWLRSTYTVQLDELPAISQENDEKLQSEGDKEITDMLRKINECKRKGKHKLFALSETNFENCGQILQLEDKESFSNGVVIILSLELCSKRKLTNKEAIENWVHKITSLPKLKVDVVTSHDVMKFDVNIVVVVVKEYVATQERTGRSRNPVKRLSDESIAGPSSDPKRLKSSEVQTPLTEEEREKQALLERLKTQATTMTAKEILRLVEMADEMQGNKR